MSSMNKSTNRLPEATTKYRLWKQDFDKKFRAGQDLNKIGLNSNPGNSANFTVEGPDAERARNARIDAEKKVVGALYADPRYATLEMALTGETTTSGRLPHGVA